jgi:hypothetical protein
VELKSKSSIADCPGVKTAGVAMAALLLSLVALPVAGMQAPPGQTQPGASPANSQPQITPQTNRFPTQSAPQDRDLEVLRRLEADYLRAEIEDNGTIAKSILADDYVGLRADGSTSDKAEVLSRLARHERSRDPYLITATNMREHLFGDSACVTYTKVYTRPGSQAAYSQNVLHLLTRRDGIWRLQLSSPLPAPRPEK